MAATSGGMTLTNTIAGTYADQHGQVYTAQSNTVVETIANVAALDVTPNNAVANPATDSAVQGQTVTRTFTIVNGGNISDAFTVIAADAGAAKINGVAFVTSSGPLNAVPNVTISPPVAAGATLALTVSVSTAGIPIGTAVPINVTIQSHAPAANGPQTVTAKQWIVVQAGPVIAGSSGATSNIVQTVNSANASAITPGSTVQFQLAFANYGGAAATNTIVVDTLPLGLSPLLASVTINSRPAGAAATLNGQTLSINVGTLPPNVTVSLSYSAIVSQTIAPGLAFLNFAQISADSLAPVVTTPTSLFVGTSNTIFDGDTGTPIAGAIVTLLDPVTNVPVLVDAPPLLRSPNTAPTNDAAAPAAMTTNPYVTSASGFYTFALSSRQIGTSAIPAHYIVTISAAGYLKRRIDVIVAPATVPTLQNTTAAATDGQPLAAAGAFTLSSAPVTLNDVNDRDANVPLFKSTPVTIVNTVDRSVAAAGDRLTYTITLTAGAGETLTATDVVAALPPGVAYAPRTARIDGTPAEPQRSGRRLNWTFDTFSTQHAIVYDAVVLPGVQEQTSLVNVASVTALSKAGRRANADAPAATVVIGGVLSDRIVITGHVYVDLLAGGRFRRGDGAIAGVRLFLEDGESVTTDRLGRFSFPAARPGQHVLQLDVTTLPSNVRISGKRPFDDNGSAVRLVHGLLDAGLMQDVDFAVEPVH